MKIQSVGQNYSINDFILFPASKDSVEVVVFGKGVGECIVVKTLTNKIIIIDSFIKDETGNPIALDYLKSVGIPFSGIKCIILTHFHDDHIKGVLKIMKETSFEPNLVINPFVGHTKILRAISKRKIKNNDVFLSGVAEITSLFNANTHFSFAAINKTVFVDEDDKLFSITALSPHDEELFKYLNSLSDESIDDVLAKYSTEKENAYSVVLLIKCSKGCFLLGGDYPNKQNGVFEGWELLTKEYIKTYDCRSVLFKIPHHGSEASFNERVWIDMLCTTPFSVGTIYNRGVKVPNQAEKEWICKKSKVLYLNGGIKSDSTTEDLFKKTTGDSKVYFKNGKIGFTRFIFKETNIPLITCFGSVEKIVSD